MAVGICVPGIPGEDASLPVCPAQDMVHGAAAGDVLDPGPVHLALLDHVMGTLPVPVARVVESLSWTRIRPTAFLPSSLSAPSWTMITSRSDWPSQPPLALEPKRTTAPRHLWPPGPGRDQKRPGRDPGGSWPAAGRRCGVVSPAAWHRLWPAGVPAGGLQVVVNRGHGLLLSRDYVPIWMESENVRMASWRRWRSCVAPSAWRALGR